jgi:hypothetical protein
VNKPPEPSDAGQFPCVLTHSRSQIPMGSKLTIGLSSFNDVLFLQFSLHEVVFDVSVFVSESQPTRTKRTTIVNNKIVLFIILLPFILHNGKLCRPALWVGTSVLFK